MGQNDAKYIYMEVTQDEYELPLVVADSAWELGQKVGSTSGNIRSAIYKVKKGTLKKSKYVRVDIND